MITWLKQHLDAMRISIFILPAVLVIAAACSPNTPMMHQSRQPDLTLEAFFEGETVAYGIFEDRYGNMKRQFRVNITGVVNENTLILDEDFLYDDGETDKRVWVITNQGIQDDGSIRYQGEAADVIGVASGQIAGNALNWVYDIDLEIGDSRLRVTFDDWIYQQDENVAINRAYISKFGINIGSVTLVFLRGDLADQVYPLDLDNWPE